jgi:hypothetical protein
MGMARPCVNISMRRELLIFFPCYDIAALGKFSVYANTTDCLLRDNNLPVVSAYFAFPEVRRFSQKQTLNF